MTPRLAIGEYGTAAAPNDGHGFTLRHGREASPQGGVAICSCPLLPGSQIPLCQWRRAQGMEAPEGCTRKRRGA